MGSLKNRMDRLEEAIHDPKDEEYRGICFHYNLPLVSDKAIKESILAIFEERPLDPVFYRPIPPGTPKRYIDEARQAYWQSLHQSKHMTSEEIQDLEQEITKLRQEIGIGAESPDSREPDHLSNPNNQNGGDDGL